MAMRRAPARLLKPAILLLVLGVSILALSLLASFFSLMTVTRELNATLELPLNSEGYIDDLFNADGRIINGSLTITSYADGTVLIALGTFTRPEAYTLDPMQSVTVDIGPGYRLDILRSNATSGSLLLALEGFVEKRPYSWMAYIGLLLFLVGTISSTLGLMMIVGLVRIGDGGVGRDGG